MKVRLPTTATLRVTPLNPHKSDWTQAKVDLHVLPSENDHLTTAEAEKVQDALRLSVVSATEPGRSFVLVEAPQESTPTYFARTFHRVCSWIGGPLRAYRPVFDANIVIDAQIPGKFDLDLEVSSGAVTIDDVFEGDVKLLVSDAEVNINKLKGMYIDIEAEDADISAGTIQGNLSVRTGAGDVDVGRVQGPSLKLVTGTGDIQTRALYADYAMVRSVSGTVRLNGAQGYTKVRTVEGDVEVAGIEGRLDVETDAGDVEASLAVPKTVSVRSRTGDIALGLPGGLSASLLVQGGGGITVDEEVGLRRDGEEGGVVYGEVVTAGGDRRVLEHASVHARAPKGDIIVRRQSWGNGSVSGEGFPRWVAATSS